MLDRDGIINMLKERRSELQARFSVLQIGIFGSYLKGTSSEKSDIDLLVDLSEPTFDHYMDLKFYLEDLFNRPVDLILYDTIKPRIRPIILQEVSYA